MISVLGMWVGITGRQLIYSAMGVLLSALCMVVSAQASEASLRVAFVYNFLKFIEWHPTNAEPIYICALGAEGAARQALVQLESKSHQQRPLQVLYLDSHADIEMHLHSCRIIYRPNNAGALMLPEPLPRGALLVADEPDPQDKQVAIALVRTRDNRIEFAINKLAVAHSGVKVSSQLLKLAKNPQREQR